MRSTIKTFLFIFGSSVILLFALLAGAQSKPEAIKEKEMFKQLELFADILARVQTDSINIPKNDELMEAAINGMLQQLDPHSSYMNAREFQKLQRNTKGEYSGVGIEVVFKNNVIVIVSPIDGSPAEKAGLKTGDKIIGVDGKSIIGEPLNPSVDKIRGKVGTPVTLTIVREEVKDPFLVTLKRASIDNKPVFHKVVEGYPYIRVSRFNEKTTLGLKQAIGELKKEIPKGFPGVILDLRGNPGGLLREAVGVSDVFLNKGEIVSIKGRKEGSEERFNGKTYDLLKDVPVVVLIDQGSASASEIVAGALQDRGRAIILGERSFGKGSVQTVLPLHGGRDGALRLTTARYYTPSGHSIQGKGIEPDFLIAKIHRKPRKELEHIYNREENLPHALKNNEGESSTEKKLKKEVELPPEDWPKKKDYQLKRAIDILKEKARKG